jgi:hypothetical protein
MCYFEILVARSVIFHHEVNPFSITARLKLAEFSMGESDAIKEVFVAIAIFYNLTNRYAVFRIIKTYKNKNVCTISRKYIKSSIEAVSGSLWTWPIWCFGHFRVSRRPDIRRHCSDFDRLEKKLCYIFCVVFKLL